MLCCDLYWQPINHTKHMFTYYICYSIYLCFVLDLSCTHVLSGYRPFSNTPSMCRLILCVCFFIFFWLVVVNDIYFAESLVILNHYCCQLSWHVCIKCAYKHVLYEDNTRLYPSERMVSNITKYNWKSD